MNMNLDDIIESFKSRVNRLSQDWDTLVSTSLSAPEEELKLLKTKLDLVQEQNSAIIVDLDQIKKVLNLDDDASNNVFTLLNTAGDGLSDAATSALTANEMVAAAINEHHGQVHHHHHHHHQPPNTPQSETSSNSNHATAGLDIASLAFDHDIQALKRRRTSSDCSAGVSIAKVGIEEDDEDVVAMQKERATLAHMQQRHTHRHISTRRSLPASHLQEIEDYELQMIDSPKDVNELYREFDTSLKLQIMEFEKRYGKGQLSRIPKIRTYQRRRALVSEIDRYARFTNKSTEEAIQFFDDIRMEKNKTVAWLYNNLGKILAEYNIV
ncbi:AER235Cp [Eremothecium gossypii ATCC 10895]|uniref:AER235Cp n=1 Tax=Eremothecium gossypii (strain ATCC 10895 / CBS 109.51 / FGSC 9923 / NRRL Y-1056) TaxID=284811 RepID=Q756L9_EREGS|nr:AER235Cp [Eremothecium gossypii ATCC 10895]AAS52916.1 AER235Cp [Eremothecium gossypii ATCC 10895]AEY97224.1 FAER235Cp [Eremothecium gossypii FDAG1]AGO12575.1 AaceriAER235Cp [[Ashbya] aceris (nom. inval.)]